MSILDSTAVLNTNEFLAVIGVGVFGTGESDSVESLKELTSKIITVVNVAGWFPIVGTIAGLASALLVGCCLFGQKKYKSAAACFAVRGILQISGLGFVTAPFDIGFSAARVVREYMKRRAAHHATS